MWMILLKFLASVVLTALLTPKPKVQNATASGINDFNFPTSSDRPIQIVIGTVRIRSPNMIWYGNLQTYPIVETIDGGWFHSDTHQTVGYQYQIDAQFALSYGEVDEISEIIIGEKSVWKRSVDDGNTARFVKPNHHGPDANSGGVSANVTFYNGTADQAADPTLIKNLGSNKVPAYQNLCHAVFSGFYVGNSTSVQPVHFVAKRLPNATSTATADYTDINGDANPAYLIFEILTNKVWGRGLPESFVDVASIENAAYTLFTENVGVSYYIDGHRTISDLVDDVCRHINGTLVEDATTGKYKLKLIRDDYHVPDLNVLDVTNVKSIKNFSRGSITKLPASVNVSYVDRNAAYNTKTVDVKNFGIKHSSLANNTINAQYLGFSTYANARRAADREMRVATSNLATCDAYVSRKHWDVEVGDAVVLSWAPLGIEQVIFRVREVDLGTLSSNEIKLSLVQDAFSLPTNEYTDESDVYAEPVAAPMGDVLVMNAPFLVSPTDNKVLLAGKASTSNQVGFEVLQKVNSDTDYTYAGKAFATTPVGLLTDPIGPGDTSISIASEDALGRLDRLGSSSLGSIQSGENLAIIEHGTGFESAFEWIAFESVVYDELTDQYTLQGIHRGLLESTPKHHNVDNSLYGAKVWFVSYGSAITTSAYSFNDNVKYKHISKTLSSELLEADAYVNSLYVADVDYLPPPVATVKINNSACTGSHNKTEDMALTCIVRTRKQSVQLQYDDSDCHATASVYARSYNAAGQLLNAKEFLYNSLSGLYEGTFAASTFGTDASYVLLFAMENGLESAHKYRIDLA